MMLTNAVLLLALLSFGIATSQTVHDRKCATHNCMLPKCRCSHAGSPDGLKPHETPQIVIFTFDDAVTKRDYDWYQFLFAPDRRNPNGCPITMTMFIQNEYTDYQLVKNLYERGMEAAVHSVTHRVPTDFWIKPTEADLKSEILDQRDNLNKKANIPLRNIKGWRSPFLQPSGELQYEILKQNGFLYDSSLTTGRRTPSDNLWPFTLDHGWPLNCEVKPCPKDRYAGLWEVPIAPLLASNGETTLHYTYVDSYRPMNGMAAYKFLKENFMAYYKGNKEPFMLNMHTAWFYFAHNLQGMDLFIRYLLTLDDVFIVSVQQALAWMEAPIPLKYTNTFKAWNCDQPQERIKPRHRPTLFVPSTPAPTTPDPRAAQRAIKCDQGVNCIKGNCRCDAPFDAKILSTKETPQIVLFTFDDAINLRNEKFYNRLFRADRKNPNGCPITMTLFLQDMYTDYNVVKKLYDRGMELAVHSITHRYPNAWWRDAERKDLIKEVVGMRVKIEQHTGIPQNHVVGWRSPFLQPTGDTLFKILSDYGFSYDSTLSVNRQNFESDQVWPFTMDYGWKRDCAIPKCPLDFYKGIWEFPVVSLVDPVTNLPCSYVDSCRPNNKSTSLNYLMSNFMSFYTGTRAPFMLNMHAAWFLLDQNLDAMDEFIAKLVAHKDVYILTVAQAMEWMKNPVSVDNSKLFKPWSCKWRPASVIPVVVSSEAPDTVTGGAVNTVGSSVSSGSQTTKSGGGGRATQRGSNGGLVSDDVGGDDDGSSDSSSMGLDWYVILLIVLVVLALLIIAALLIVSIVKKNQALQLKRVAQLAASMAGDTESNEGIDIPAVDRVKTLETLKNISGSRNNVNDNIYHSIMELRRSNPPASRMSLNESARPSETASAPRGHRQRTTRNVPLPRPPSQETTKFTSSKAQDTTKLVSGKASTNEQSSKPRVKLAAPSSSRYEGDLETVRNSVMDDLNEFSRNHTRMSVASVDSHYYSLDDPWLNLNLQGDRDKYSN